MSDPISSLTSSDPSNACFDEGACATSTPTTSAGAHDAQAVASFDPNAEALQSPSSEPTSCESTAAVKSLVDRFSPSSTPSWVQGSSPTAPTPVTWPSDSNASRTTARSNDFSPYTASGKTSDGQGVFAGAALMKTHVSGGLMDNTEVEILSASAQLGPQSEAQVGLVRAGATTPLYLADGTLSAEALTARANLGIVNDDGSVGLNFGATAELVGFESTLSHSGWSVTGGLSAQAGGYVSAGMRDADHDGRPEVCAKLSAPAITFGACIENPF